MDTHRPQSCPTPETSSARVGAGNGEAPIENPTDAFRDISERIAQLKAYASYYLAAKMDSIKLSARNAAIYAALGVVGLIAGGTIIAMAAALVVLGIAHGLGSLFGPAGSATSSPASSSSASSPPALCSVCVPSPTRHGKGR